MKNKDFTGIIPSQHTGNEIEADACIELNEEEAKRFYETAKQRLLHINNWHKLAGIVSAVFQLVDAAGNEIGIALPGAEAAKQLELIGGWMKLNVPRFEGPQSDKDTANYNQMAAQVGDSNIPVSSRLKALEKLEELNKKIPDLDSTRRTPEGKPRPPLSAFGGR